MVKRYILKAMGLLHRSDLARYAVAFLGRKTVREAEETLVRCHGIGRFAFGLDFSPSLASSRIEPGKRIGGLGGSPPVPWANGLTGCRSRNPLDFKYLHATTCRAEGRVEMGFEGPARLAGAWTVSVRLRLVGKGSGSARIRVRIQGRDLGTRPLAPGWQDLTWTFQGGSRESRGGRSRSGGQGARPGKGRAEETKALVSGSELKILDAVIEPVPPDLELELDHFLLLPSR